jgi:hypothetical protein
MAAPPISFGIWSSRKMHNTPESWQQRELRRKEFADNLYIYALSLIEEVAAGHDEAEFRCLMMAAATGRSRGMGYSIT